MKNLLIVFAILFSSLLSAQQTKNDQAQNEKSFIGQWSFDNPNHMMLSTIPGSTNKFTVKLNSDKTLTYTDFYAKKGVELVTITGTGTWKLSGDQIEFTYSPKSVITRNGKPMPDAKVTKTYSGSDKKLNDAVGKIKEKERLVKFYYKFDNNKLLFSIKKGNFDQSAVFIKN